MTNFQILLEASKNQDLDSKQLKKFTRLLKFVYPEAVVTMNKKIIQKIQFMEFQLIILLNPQNPFNKEESDQIKQYLGSNGKLIVFIQPINETIVQNFNFILQDYQISLNKDKVMRTQYKKGYYNPNIAYIDNGVLNRAVCHYFKIEKSELNVLLPFASSLNCQFPSIPLLGTGLHCFPVNRPVCAVSDTSNGKLIVCTSFQLILDKYIESLENSKFVEFLLQYFKGDVVLNEIDMRDPGINEYILSSDISEMASQLQYGIEEIDSVDMDVQKLNNKEVFHLTTNTVPLIKQLYSTLLIPFEPLDIIPPEYSAPLPMLKLATFHPTMRTIPQAPLELFDLDEHCATEKERLGMLVNKCNYYSYRQDR